ncbi:hypothetical protein SAMCFNEI73_pA0016 (plasmid) [Sinorhizobium americanum]|uniref:Uncharacterized protein n=2 Tax=Sinorhizobium americanum TaxID=194963 RepID=A0A1L3LSF9_9HYPH|nr:hypothetical protein SAMCFNEI73_pA0016 [Sinorhizobium americanum]
MFLKRAEAAPDRADLGNAMRKLREGWFDEGLLERGRLQSEAIEIAVGIRKDWARKFDPIRLTIEHAAFVEEHIQDGETGVRKTAVDVLNPDITLMEKAGVAGELKRYQSDIKDVFGKTGISHMYLLRSLPICEYSFGYTRGKRQAEAIQPT